jgi:hypothetical protein
MPYPKQIQKLIKDHSSLMAKYVEEETKLYKLQDKNKEAEYNDIEALREAAIAGEPDPGDQATTDSARAVEYQAIRTRAAVKAVRDATSLVDTALIENRLVVIELACKMLEKGASKWDQALVKIQVDFAEAYEAKRESMNGMKSVLELNLTTPEMSFSLNGISLQSEGFQLPKADKASLLLVQHMRNTYAKKAKPEESTAEIAEVAEVPEEITK